LGASADLVLIHAYRGSPFAFDLKTGGTRQGFSGMGSASDPRLSSLEDKRVAAYFAKSGEMTVWDEKTGQELKKIAIPHSPPAGTTPASLRVQLSPNAKFAVAAWQRGILAKDDEFPLRVIDLEKQMVLTELKWTGGQIHFTADSSRVLIADFKGQCSWVKLPSGEIEPQWTLPAPVSPRYHEVTSISADGSVLGYRGPAGRKENSTGPALLDGATGKVIHLFSSDYYYGSRVGLSADGRRAGIQRNAPDGFRSYDIVDTRNGAVLGRTTVQTGPSVPPFDITPDGTAVIVIAKLEKKICVFELDTGNGASPKLPAPSPDSGQLTIKERHKVELKFGPNALKLAPDGQSFIVYDYKKSAAIVDVQSGAVRDLPLTGNLVPESIVVLQSGKAGVWCFGSKELPIVDAKTGKSAGSLPLPELLVGSGVPLKIAVSPNERFVAASQFEKATFDPKTKLSIYHPVPLRVLDTNKKTTVVETDWQGGSLFFSADSSRLLAIDHLFHARWFNLSTGKVDKEWTFKHQTSDRRQFQFLGSANENRVLLCSGPIDGRNEYFLLDTETGEPSRVFMGVTGQCVGLSSDGKLALFRVAKSTELILSIFDMAKKAEVGRLAIPFQEKTPPRVTFAPDGRSVVVFDFRLSTVVIYEVTGSADVGVGPAPNPSKVSELKVLWEKEVKLKTDFVATPDFDIEGQTTFLSTVATNKPSVIAAFDARTGKMISERPEIPDIVSRLFPMEKGKVAYQLSTGEITVWDSETGKTTQVVQLKGSPGETMYTRLSPNGKYLTVCFLRPGLDLKAAARVQVVDSKTGKTIITWGERIGEVRTAFTPDSERVLIWDKGGQFRWYNCATGKLDAEWKLDESVGKTNSHVMAVSADGSVILLHAVPQAIARHEYHILDGKKGTVRHTFPAGRYHWSGVHPAGCSLSEDGRFVTLVRTENQSGKSRVHLDILDVSGTLLATLTLPEGIKTENLVATSWKAGLVVFHDAQNGKLIACELPALPKP
jgi:hypothetical protein